MEDILKSLNDFYHNKEFTYVSKYGNTIGVVREINVVQKCLINKDKLLRQPIFKIKSTNGIVYDMNDCFFEN